MSEDFTPAVRNETTAPILPYAAPTPVAPTTPAVPAGWHPHPQNPGLLRYWDGQAWTDHTAPTHQPAGPAAPVAQQPQQIVIQQSNNMGGGYGPRTNHALHFVLTVLTGGLWLVVWIPVAISNNAKQNRMQVGGNTHYR